MKPTIITLFTALLFASCGEEPKKQNPASASLLARTGHK